MSNEMKKKVDFKDIQDRIIKLFEDRGFLQYERIDVQTIPSIQYFKSVCFGKFIKQDPDSDPFKRRDDMTPSYYFTTTDDAAGVKSRDDLPERWVKTFIIQNNGYAKKYGANYPSLLKELVASNVSELCLKMGILGI